MQDLPHFLALILWNFWTVAAGVMLAFEPVMRWFFEKYDTTAARYIPPHQRRRAARIAALCAFVFANYLAFHDLNDENRSLKAERATSNQSPYRWPLLTPQETAALRAKFREIPATTAAIVCSEEQCADFARSFEDVFEGLGWKITCCNYSFSGFDPGIHLWGENQQLLGLANKIESATNGRLKVDFSERPPLDITQFNLQISIGPKPKV
jgi:hypothetical protein